MSPTATSKVPEAIVEAATSMLLPYAPGLTPEKLKNAILFEPEESPKGQIRSRMEASEALYVSLPTVDRMLASGELTRVNVRGRVFIRQSEIDRILSGEVAK